MKMKGIVTDLAKFCWKPEHSVQNVPHSVSLTPPNNSGSRFYCTIILVLQIRMLRFREAKQLAPSHTASKWQVDSTVPEWLPALDRGQDLYVPKPKTRINERRNEQRLKYTARVPKTEGLRVSH